MTTFVDTSAFFAVLSADEADTDRATRWLEQIAATEDERLLTHSYVVTESIALIHRRLGTDMVKTFLDDLLPVCEIRYVGKDLHERATVAYLSSLSRSSSFVDRTSFELMRAEGIRQAFTLDPDFASAGFETVP
ncbi:MAG TPA: PIN domain-containing protein [Actinomycetota bacterium]